MSVRRNRGEGGIEKIGNIYYYSFYDLNGKQVRRSSKSKLKAVAIEMLQDAREQLRQGIEVSSVRKTKYEEIRALLVADYVASGRAMLDSDEFLIAGRRGLLKPLDNYFAGMKVASITTDVLRRFSEQRMAQGVAGPTVNRNLALLRRMFNLAKLEGKVSSVPHFPMHKESKPRQGFLERHEFEKLRAAMPESLHPALTFCYESGCRTGAMEKVIWPWVDTDAQEIHFPPGVLKNGEPLVVPLSNELVAMLKRKFRGDGRVFVTKNFRREWNRACAQTGFGKKTGKEWYQYKGLIPHDLRRSAARNLVRAGVDMTTAMKITGHRTLDIFLRYNIVSTVDLHEAMEKVTSKKKVAK
jgi:integrase